MCENKRRANTRFGGVCVERGGERCSKQINKCWITHTNSHTHIQKSSNQGTLPSYPSRYEDFFFSLVKNQVKNGSLRLLASLQLYYETRLLNHPTLTIVTKTTCSRFHRGSTWKCTRSAPHKCCQTLTMSMTHILCCASITAVRTNNIENNKTRRQTTCHP